jgi:Zn-dependent peptidase ImmA (M78 family)
MEAHVKEPVISVREAREIIRAHQTQTPVQMVKLAEALGAEVYKVAEWKESISGMILRNKNADNRDGKHYKIYVNANHSWERRRFTIAHEIAHMVLHTNLIGDSLQDDGLYRSGLSNALEAQANNFAADILMPWHLINEAMDSTPDASVGKLADIFEVSKSAMSIRLGVPFETRAN